MQTPRARQALRITRTAAYVLAVPLVLLPLAAALIDVGLFQRPLLHLVLARAGRPVRIDGGIQAHLLSWHPGIIASQIAIDNPPWVEPGPLARIQRLELHWDLPTLRRGLRLGTLEMNGATFHFLRDADGNANWQARPPRSGRGNGPPLLRVLSVPGARVTLQDARRHLQFDGTVTASAAAGTRMPARLRIEARGQLNGRAAIIRLQGDPLESTRRGHPYHFDFDARSSGSRLTGAGVVPEPFKFHVLDASFAATGENMKDLYYLTGMTLPNTGSYRLGGMLQRRDTSFKYSQLAASSGASDMRGTIAIETGSGRTRVAADLHSHHLRSADLGARAAARAPLAEPQRLLPDTPIPLKGIRRADATFKFHGETVEVGRIPLQDVSMQVTIQDGRLLATPLAARFALGSLHGRAELDAARDPPTGLLDLQTNNIELAELPHSAHREESPATGRMQARIELKGRGRSIHELAATSDGTITAVVPRGTIRASLAEASGLDLRGIGLKLAADHEQTAIRCGIASFEVHGGVLDSKQLMIDTEPVLIGGSGTVDLKSERLDLSFRGEPKHPRLRLRAPIVVAGTLLHPTFGLGTRTIGAAQTGAAIALGVVLTPIAAALAFVDPGLAKDADCAALIAATTHRSGKP